jgi:hypothetical protein
VKWRDSKLLYKIKNPEQSDESKSRKLVAKWTYKLIVNINAFILLYRDTYFFFYFLRIELYNSFQLIHNEESFLLIQDLY